MNEILKDFVIEIKECLDELDTEEKNDITNGQRLAFAHILRMIKGGYVLPDELSAFGLDIDIDKKYLSS